MKEIIRSDMRNDAEFIRNFDNMDDKTTPYWLSIFGQDAFCQVYVFLGDGQPTLQTVFTSFDSQGEQRTYKYRLFLWIVRRIKMGKRAAVIGGVADLTAATMQNKKEYDFNQTSIKIQ